MPHRILESKESLAHDSALLHVQGSAEFIDDRPCVARELLVGLVSSPHARARIRAIDVSKALNIAGIIAIYDHTSLSHNLWGSIFQDQVLLAAGEVNYVGEVILILAATDERAIRAAQKAILIDYDVLPAILSIDAARHKESFIGSERQIARGDVAAALHQAPHRLHSQVQIDGADHFYLENQVAIAYPRDDGVLEVHSSTQHPTEVQALVAEALGLASKDVVCQVKRLGGAFGGKETQAAPFAVYAAVVAHHCRRPARVLLTKDDDMLMTGKRNPFQVSYDVGFAADGTIMALDAQLFSDGGAYADLSTAIMERAMTHVDNAYFLPTVRIRGQVCRTNVHPHTAFRGFGGPKGVALIEHAIEHIAHYLSLDAYDVRFRNCYHGPERSRTPYGQLVVGDQLRPLFTSLAERCAYRSRRAALSTAQPQPGQLLRGLSLTAVKFGISFITRFLNQGNALIHIYQDGSLQVTTGAIEMGQGVHTRIAQLVAEEFALPVSRIRVMTTQTDKNANTSATAASSGTDLNGSAALVACRRLKQRLALMYQALIAVDPELWPSRTIGLGLTDDLRLADELAAPVTFADHKVYVEGQPHRAIDFSVLVREAYFNRVPLSEYGFYKIEDLDFNKVSGEGRAFLYFTQGVACSEVEVNPGTGEVKVLRSDILMDLGRPINQAMDVGQIRGAFIQGLGWITTEQLVYSDGGRLLSHSPSTYKIPTVHDIPRIFNVDLIESIETTTMHKGRAVGEPPLLLSFSVWTAIMNALNQNRAPDQFASLAIPASRERILRVLHPGEFARWEAASP